MRGQRARERSEPLPKLCEECKRRRLPYGEGVPMLRRANTRADRSRDRRWRACRIGFASQRSAAPTIADKVSFFGELCWIARDRGYNAGWARTSIGNGSASGRMTRACAARRPTPPSLKTKNWIVSRRIAFAKAKERVARG